MKSVRQYLCRAYCTTSAGHSQHQMHLGPFSLICRAIPISVLTTDWILSWCLVLPFLLWRFSGKGHIHRQLQIISYWTDLVPLQEKLAIFAALRLILIGAFSCDSCVIFAGYIDKPLPLPLPGVPPLNSVFWSIEIDYINELPDCSSSCQLV